MRTLALEWGESPEDLLALAIKVIADENARTIENRTHLASACKSFTRTNPVTPERVERIVTPDYIEHVIVPEICDNIAQKHIENLLDRMLGDEWNAQHPEQGQMPESVLRQIHALRCVDGRGWQDAEWKACLLEHEWAHKLGWYQGQYHHILGTVCLKWDTRMSQSIKEAHPSYMRKNERRGAQ